MVTAQFEIQAIGVVVAVACALPGVFLVLRRMAMMSDAISHSILLGIVLAFFLVKDLASPWLIVGAAITGVVTVSLSEILLKTRLVKQDVSIGLAFPLLFSLGVILISRYSGNVHLDIDMVLLGELAFAPFDRFIANGIDLGPRSLWVMSGILLLNVVFIAVFFKELKIATFDAGLAASLGFLPGVIHYGLMSVVSVTAVGAFDAVGSILVVALMIVPPATAYLLTDRLLIMIALSAFFGALSAISGYWMAHLLDASIAGAMATMAGVFFGLTYLMAPNRGLLAVAQRRRDQKWEFARKMLTVHMYQHENTEDEETECSLPHLQDHFMWTQHFAQTTVKSLVRDKLIEIENGILKLTKNGREVAREAIVQ